VIGKGWILIWRHMLHKTPALPNRVARWFVFKPKIPIWVNFGGSAARRSKNEYFRANNLFARLCIFHYDKCRYSAHVFIWPYG
jgi:hypothetical protein